MSTKTVSFVKRVYPPIPKSPAVVFHSADDDDDSTILYCPESPNITGTQCSVCSCYGYRNTCCIPDYYNDEDSASAAPSAR